MVRKLSTCLLFLALALPGVALAQGTGTLAGVVIDAETGEGLPGANVRIEGTTLGDATDVDGSYRIIGVPVGEYSITASFAGYEAVTQTGVTINNGYTRQLDFELGASELGEVVVEYERPIIQNDAIGAPRVVSGDDIQNLPVRGAASVASLQSGTVSSDQTSTLNIRGGRGEEVQYFVDGVKVLNTLAVNQADIQEQEMLIGTIPARYGDVQSGVISITTKTGREDFFGSGELITSEALDAYGYNLASLSLGGPLVPGSVGFFLSGQGTFIADNDPYGVKTYQLSEADLQELQENPQLLDVIDGDGNSRYVDFPYQILDELLGDGVDGNIGRDSLQAIMLERGLLAEGDSIARGGFVINAPETYTAENFQLIDGKDEPARDFTLNGSLNFTLGSSVSLRLGGGYSTFENDDYRFSGSLYNRNAYNIYERENWRVYGTFRQRLSDIAFYELRGEYQNFGDVLYPNGFSDNVEDALRYGDIDDDNFYNQIARRYYIQDQDGIYGRVHTLDSGVRPGQVSGTFDLPGRPLAFFRKRNNQQIRFSGSATTQLGVHQLEFGGEWEQQTNRYYDLSGFGLASFIDNDDDGTFNPRRTLDLDEDGEADIFRSYGDLPPEAFGSSFTNYGYNYNGTQEVNDQNIAAFFDVEDTSPASYNVRPYEPIYYAGYLADKIEYQDLVLNLGLRVDVFDNNTTVLRDIFAPRPVTRVEDIEGAPSAADPDWAVYYNDGGSIVGYRDLDGNFYNTSGTQVREQEVTLSASGSMQETDEPITEAFTEYEPKVTVMPRVGVSFPVTNRALFFASYNVTSQRPTERAFAPFTVYRGLNSQQSRVPNPTLAPERTVQYELGFRQRLGERAATTVSGFYRTQENKITNRRLDGGLSSYGTYRNLDFTTSKGVEFGFELRRTQNLALNANYTLSFSSGTGSDAAATANIVWRGDYFPRVITPSTFDQRHTVNVSADYRFGKGEGPMIGGINPLENFGVNLTGQFGSGQRYTALQAGQIFSIFDSFTDSPEGDVNSATLPAYTNLNLRVDRSFDVFGGLSAKAYLWVQNVLDSDNVLAVYRATGVPDTDGFLQSDDSRQFRDGAVDLEGRLFNYSAYTSGPLNIGGNQSSSGSYFYSLPRRVRLGLLFNF